MNKPVAWQVAEMLFDIEESAIEMAKVYGDKIIPLYTQDQLEEARKLGMQQERALWNLAESTQEIMNPYKAITDTKIEPTVVSYTHPVKELTVPDGLIDPKSYYIGYEDGKKKSQADIEYEADKAYWRNRTLTDEEIYELADQCRKLANPNVEFARAILRKAQEK